MAFKVRIDLEAIEDIQKAINWYNQQQPGLGGKFHEEVKEYFLKLESNPFFQVRYNNVHCLPLRNYPYMIHYTVHEDEKMVVVRAVFNTNRNPKLWKDRK